MDFILNGECHGTAAARIMAHGFDPDAMRPIEIPDGSGRAYIQVRNGKNKDGTLRYAKKLVHNAPTTLRYDEWKAFDDTVRDVARAEMNVVGDILSRGLRKTIPGGMGKTLLQHQTTSDIGDATMSMDGLRRGENDRPLKEIATLPLVFTHKDFTIGLRDLEQSRQSGEGLDTTDVRLATIKCMESLEKLTVGTLTFPTVAGATIYGMTTYTYRMTKTITAPTAGGWTPETFVLELLAGRQQMRDAYQRGPMMIYLGYAWEQYLDADYSAAKGQNTLRQRLLAIDRVAGIKILDYLTGFQAIALIMTEENVRMVSFFPLRVIRWEEQGGWEIHLKVILGMVPQFRADYNNRMGMLHMNTA